MVGRAELVRRVWWVGVTNRQDHQLSVASPQSEMGQSVILQLWAWSPA